MEQLTLKVEGMSCNHCVQSVEGALQKIGVSGKVDLAKGTVAVEFDAQKVTPEKIKEAITDQGYDIV